MHLDENSIKRTYCHCADFSEQIDYQFHFHFNRLKVFLHCQKIDSLQSQQDKEIDLKKMGMNPFIS